MSVIQKAVEWIVSIANDNSHGYDQTNRWGPNYDCSALVISSFKQAGVALTCTYTGNMFNDMTAKGFKNVTSLVNLATGAGMQAGDVLLNVVNHTAMYIGNGQICQAGGNEFGGIVGGQTGDQTGKEICCMGYYNFPWNYVLRYEETPTTQKTTTTTTTGIYTVKSGDTLWGIAQEQLGDGNRYPDIMKWNNLTTTKIQIGQQLKLSASTTTTTTTSTVTTNVSVFLPQLKFGDVSGAVKAMQTLLVLRGCTLKDGADGDFGSNTLAAVKQYQTAKQLSVDGVCGAKTWQALING